MLMTLPSRLRRPRALLLGAAALACAAVAFGAWHAPPSGMGGDAGLMARLMDVCTSRDPAQAGFAAENDAAMARMMAGMAIKSSGDVDRDFAEMMTAHHQGAIDMALAELRHGSNEQLRRMRSPRCAWRSTSRCRPPRPRPRSLLARKRRQVHLHFPSSTRTP
jgi:Domain of unknown function (DUF305)